MQIDTNILPSNNVKHPLGIKSNAGALDCCAYDYGDLMPSPDVFVKERISNIHEMLGGQVIIVNSKQEVSTYNQVPEKIYTGWSELTVAIVALSIYSILLYLYKSAIPQIFKANFYHYSAEKLADTLDVNVKKAFSLSPILMVLAFALMINSYFSQEIATFNYINKELYLPVTVAIILIFLLYRYLMISVIRHISSNVDFFSKVVFCNNITITFWTIIIFPATILSCYSNGTISNLLEYSAYIGTAAMLIQYVTKTYLIFRAENISFFQYILYLCATEILPISFLFTLTSRI